MKFPQWNLLLIRNRIKYLFQIHIIKLPCKLHTEVVQEFVIQKVINGYCNLVKMTDHFLMNASTCINKKEFSFTFNTSFFCKPISLNFENDTACPFLNICSSNTAFPMVLQMSCKHIGCKQMNHWSWCLEQHHGPTEIMCKIYHNWHENSCFFAFQHCTNFLVSIIIIC